MPSAFALRPDDLPARFGRFELVTVLGEGGMGRVWGAQLLGPDGFRKAVALKVVRAGAFEKIGEDGFAGEARVGGLLQHPHLVEIYDHGWEGDEPWIAMEWVRGESLAGRLARGPVGPADILRIGVGIARGLAALHGLHTEGESRGIVHRDLKPGNVLLGGEGQVKVSDFGLARAFHAAGEAPSSVLRGTPAYMAPEQARSEPLDGRTDIWALGALLWEMATGERLLRGSNLMEIVRMLLDLDDRLTESHRVDDAVPGLGDLVRSCLASDPALRPEHASEVADALQALGRDSAAPATPSRQGVWPPNAEAETIYAPAPRGTGALRIVRLPSPPDRFIGRKAELDRLAPLLEARPILTLLGPGGAGKTRLAVALAHAGLEHYAACYFMDLSAARDPAAMRTIVLGQLGLEAAGDAEPAILTALQTRGRVLLLLDNLEQCDGAGPVIAAWSRALPATRILVTSRAPLGISTEFCVGVEPLGELDGVELFVDRSGRDPADPAIADLVARLDGLPLAIELAAARARSLSPAAIRDRLKDRFRLLAGGRTDLPARQATLRATLDWSWDLLRPWEKAAWVRLAFFLGPFPLDAAESVLEAEGGLSELWPDAPWTPDLVTSLVDQSLLRPSGPRFVMLQTLAEYGRERATSTENQAARAAHARCFLHLARRADPGDPDARAILLPATADLEAAARHLIDAGQTSEGGEILLLLHGVLRDLGTARGLSTLVHDVAARLGPSALAADLLGSEAVALLMGGSLEEALALLFEADGIAQGVRAVQVRSRLALYRTEVLLRLGRVAEAEGSLAEARAAPDPRFLACGRLDDVEASLRWFQGRTEESLVCAQRAVAAAKRSGRPLSVPNGLLISGVALVQLGRIDEARARYQEVLAAARRWSMPGLESVVRNNLAVLDHQDGRLDEARQGYLAARELARTMGERRLDGVSTGNLGIVEHDTGRFEGALECYDDAVALLRAVGDRRFLGWFLALRGAALADLGRVAEAAAALDEGVAHVEATGDPMLAQAVALCRGHLDCASGRDSEARERAVAVRAGPIRSDNVRFALRLLERRLDRDQGR